jgi:hypothetical protein
VKKIITFQIIKFILAGFAKSREGICTYNENKLNEINQFLVCKIREEINFIFARRAGQEILEINVAKICQKYTVQYAGARPSFKTQKGQQTLQPRI